jgi:serine/threonine protein phosphatase PrpC
VSAILIWTIGVLAVTRSLGDSSMKDYVVGSPYTTETELCDVDEFLIIACDGVRLSSPSSLPHTQT